eukprot:TRINITY_DN7748_c0_g1_i1.p1 TRINITY_DN7748_c0_g1~~TRINITY_DN7748_c0_g1_i1.p1  ORF type:complete len:585 (+),score=229.66 TRINITY_DN7748_c0_g1_i1:58-1755(+)
MLAAAALLSAAAPAAGLNDTDYELGYCTSLSPAAPPPTPPGFWCSPGNRCKGHSDCWIQTQNCCYCDANATDPKYPGTGQCVHRDPCAAGHKQCGDHCYPLVNGSGVMTCLRSPASAAPRPSYTQRQCRAKVTVGWNTLAQAIGWACDPATGVNCGMIQGGGCCLWPVPGLNPKGFPDANVFSQASYAFNQRYQMTGGDRAACDFNGVAVPQEWPEIGGVADEVAGPTAAKGHPATAANATVLWSASLGGPLFASPTASGDSLYVAGYDGKLYALRRKDGAVRWVVPLDGPSETTPAVGGGMVFAGTQGPGNGESGTLFAVHASNGTVAWRHSVAGPVVAAPVYHEDAVIFGSFDFKLHSLAAADGSVRWVNTYNQRMHASPTISGGLLFVGSSDDSFYVVNASTGRYAWSAAAGDCILSQAAVAGESVYFGSDDMKVWSFNKENGDLNWYTPTQGLVQAGPALADGVAVVPSFDGMLYGLSAANGTVLWNVTIGASSSTPAVMGGAAVLGAGDGLLRAVDVSSGALQWVHQFGASVVSHPLVADGTVYVSGLDSTVVALRPPSA